MMIVPPYNEEQIPSRHVATQTPEHLIFLARLRQAQKEDPGNSERSNRRQSCGAPLCQRASSATLTRPQRASSSPHPQAPAGFSDTHSAAAVLVRAPASPGGFSDNAPDLRDSPLVPARQFPSRRRPQSSLVVLIERSLIFILDYGMVPVF